MACISSVSGSVSVSGCASLGVSVDVDMIEGANVERKDVGVKEPVWVCPRCQKQWQPGDKTWLGCDDCHRNWHPRCMPRRMKVASLDSIDKKTSWTCW